MRDKYLVDEHRGLGSLTERIVAAVLGRTDTTSSKEDQVSKVNISEYEGNRDAAKVDVVELEDRMKKELRVLMLLGEHEEVSQDRSTSGSMSHLCRLTLRGSLTLLAETMTRSPPHFDNVSDSSCNRLP